MAARHAAGVAWQGEKWIFTTRGGTPIEPRNFNRSWDTRCRKVGVHAQISVTMEIYAQASSKATRAALKRLGDSLDK